MALGTMAALFRFDVGAAVPAYMQGCRSLTIDEFEAACALATEKLEHMPVPAQLLKLARDARAKADGRIQIGQGEWVADPWKQRPRAQLPGNVAKRMAPPVPTYAECIGSCQQNIDEATERARNAPDTDDGRMVRREALNAMKHWREMRVWYEGQAKAGRGEERIAIGSFVPPEAQTPPQQPPVAPEPHWSEGREVGADDLEEAPF